MADVTQTAANVRANAGATVQVVRVGATVTPGDFLYSDTTDNGDYKLASTASDAASNAAAMSLGYGDDGDLVPVAVAGTVEIGGTTVKGTIYTAADTAGGIRPNADNASGDFVTILGVASDTAGTLKLSFFKSGISVT